MRHRQTNSRRLSAGSVGAACACCWSGSRWYAGGGMWQPAYGFGVHAASPDAKLATWKLGTWRRSAECHGGMPDQSPATL